MKVWRLPLCVALLANLPVGNAACAEESGGAVDATAKTQSKITISKETSYITKPFDADGYPDYLAAINERLSDGVTKENNAAVLLVEALGPSVIPDTIRKEALRRLDLSDLSANGAYIVSRDAMIKRWRAGEPDGKQDSEELLQQQFDDAQSRPWSQKEFPIVAEWLSVNVKPLEIACRATKRTKCYFPYLSKPGHYTPVIAVLLPLAQESRDIARLLTVRAMQRLQENDIDGAWQDLQCCHRLGRLVSQGAFLIEGFVGYSIDQIAAIGDVAVAHYGKLSAKRALQMQADLRALPPLVEIVSKFDFSERISCLDSTVYCAREGARSIFTLLTTASLGGNPKPTDKAIGELDSSIDWNLVARTVNQWYDRSSSIFRISDARKRREGVRQVEKDLKERNDKMTSPAGSSVNDYLLKSPTSEVSRRVGDVIVGLLLPALNAVIMAPERVNLIGQLDQTAFALAAYRAEHGRYPEALDALTPTYLASIPDDTFANKPTPIRYRREADAYLLWSVGMNGVDDSGRTSDDDPKADDWVLRPVAK